MQHCSTLSHWVNVVDIEEAKLRQLIRKIAAEYILWGLRMSFRLLRREGCTVNYSRLQRLRMDEGLQSPCWS